MAAHQAQEHRIAAAEPLTRAATERRRNRTFQPVGCTGLPVLKCVALRLAQVFSAQVRASWFAEFSSELPSSGHVSEHETHPARRESALGQWSASSSSSR